MSQKLWEHEYKPVKFNDLIINDDLKPVLKKALDEMPNLFIYGKPGVGKGSFVNVFINYNNLQNNTLTINASDETGVENIRTKVKSFATSVSFNGLKLVYLNEVDFISNSGQALLRQLIEDVQANTRFILACNYESKIIPELKSRCQSIHITNPPAVDILKKCEYILKNENIKYNKKTIVDIIKKCYPDIRNTIVTLRQNCIDNVLSDKVVVSTSEKIFAEVLSEMKNGDPDKIRRKLHSYPIDYSALYKFLYEKLMTEEDNVFKDDATAILLLGTHFYRNSVVDIPEINFMHMVFKMLRDKVI